MAITIAEQARRLLLRDLRVVQDELRAYPSDESVWELPDGIRNSAGTLALHIAGNLRHFIGSQLGGTDYVRDREREFAARGLPRAELLRHLDDAIAEVDRTLTGLDDDTLTRPFPMRFGDVELPAGQFVLHLASHLTYHLGQIDYHRRVVTGEPGEVKALSVVALAGGPV